MRTFGSPACASLSYLGPVLSRPPSRPVCVCVVSVSLESHSVKLSQQKRQTRWLASLAFDLPQPLSLTARCVGSVHVAPGQLIPASAAATGQLQALLAERDATLEAECTECMLMCPALSQ